MAQRAWQSVSLITSPRSKVTYAVAVSTWNAISALEESLGLSTFKLGSPAGDPCWLNENDLTENLEFHNTIYGTNYGMKYCEERDALNELLARPGNVAAWHASLYNHEASPMSLLSFTELTSSPVLCCGSHTRPWGSHPRSVGRSLSTMAAVLVG